MKKIFRLTLAGFIAVLGLLATPLAAPQAGAINVFPDAVCDGGSGGTGDSAEGGTDMNLDDMNGEDSESAEGTGSAGGSSSAICGAAKQDDAQDIIKNVINTILVVLGMIAVIMIVIGGVRYTTSNGDASGVKGAKDTILYAVVGLVVAILAYAIVNFVLGRFS
jgi:hypothetical protein